MTKPFLNEFLRFDDTSTFCFFDFETEGLNLFRARPWQVGVIMVKGDESYEEHDIYVYWKDLKVSKEAAAKTGYDEEKVKRLGITPEAALDILEDKFNSADYVIGHNAVFYDNYIYRGWCKKLGRKPIDLREKLLDTFLFAKSIKLDIPFRPDVDRFAFFMKLYGEIVKRLGTSLSVLAKEHGFDVDQGQTHDALYDLRMNVHVWNKIKWTIPV